MSDDRTLNFIRRMSYLLDSAIPIPGTKYRFGLDPIIGLIPGIGDAVSSLMSSLVVLTAIQLKVSRWTLTRMVFNIIIDSLVGIIPIAGDFFDAYWKSNERNRILLERGLADPKKKAADMVFIIGLLLVLVIIVGSTTWAAIQVVSWLLSLL